MKMLKDLENRLETNEKKADNNEKNILDNIKDINLLNKDMVQAKEDIENLKKSLMNSGGDKNSNEKKGNIDFGSESINNINKEVMRNRE